MTPINVTLVKVVRERTGAGVIDCKNALAQTHGDLEAAVELLRAAEIVKAAKKADRVAAEGLVGLVVQGLAGALVELNTETDFVAHTEAFRDAASAVAGIALSVQGDHAALLNAPAPDGDGRVSDVIARLTARTGERVTLRRSAFVSASRGVVASYLHGAAAPGLGRIGVLVALESAGSQDVLFDLGHKVAMHIAAGSPQWVAKEDIPPALVEEKHAELTAQARQTAKAPAIVEKMVEGRMRKFYEEVVLGLQPFVLSPDQRVDQAVRDAEQAAGCPITIAAFARLQTGEGIDKKTEDGHSRNG
jgi:elongation factor Ts